MAEPDFISSESASGRVYVNPAFREAVEGLSLRRFAEAMRFIGGETVDLNRKRSVARVEWKGEAFFLKRFTRPPARDALSQLFRFRRPRTHAWMEWKMAEALREAGIGAPEIAAVGEASGTGLRRPSFLLTVELKDRTPLSVYLLAQGERFGRVGERSAFIAEVARLVRRMHDAGITHPDLYSYHVFVGEAGAGWDFSLIDLHRASRKARISLFDAVRDLTGLHLTVPPPLASRTDRVRFLRAYFGSGRLKTAAKRLARKILRRSARIGSRKRFRKIRENAGRGAVLP